MLTPQEVEERVFPKAKKGGYDMQDVDNFLDQLTADYSELYKENAVLKRKMKVLADKITEYQETEGAMRATLLSAQKMANQIVEEAKEKRTKMLEEAESIARERADTLAQQVADEEAKLKSARASVAAMTASIRDLLAHEQAFLDSLPQAQAADLPAADTDEAEGSAAADAVTAQIGDSIRRMMEDEAATEAAEEKAEAEKKAEAQEQAGQPEDEPAGPDGDAPEGEDKAGDTKKTAARRPTTRIVDDDVDDAPTRRLDLSELRFGRNYEIK